MQERNLRQKYLKEITPRLKTKLAKKNIYEVPKLSKIVINAGFGSLAPDQKGLEQISNDFGRITGQKPLFTKARKAIAGFKIREGQVIGMKTTLRGQKMYDFFEKLVKIILPRLRDFRGVSARAFDQNGSYTLGFRELAVFPEIEYKRTERPVGLEVTICTTAQSPEEARELLTELGMPFKKEAQTVKERVEAT